MTSDVWFDIETVWGKAGGGNVPHPLVCHALDTAVVAERLAGVLLGPHCLKALEDAFAPVGDPLGWISVLAGLHDLGKCSPTFQGLREDVAVAAMGEGPARDIRRLTHWDVSGARTDCHHGLLSTVHWQRILEEWGAERRTARTVARALGGHHGIVGEAEAVRQVRAATGDNGGERWARSCDELVEQVVSLWRLPDPRELPWEKVRLSPQAVVGLAGLTSVSDWIASSRPTADHAGTQVELTTYLRQARWYEARKVDGLKWRPWAPPQDTGFRALFPEEERPHPVQEAVEVLVGRMRGPGIVVVSAPTGEGKTKAALQAAASLVKRFGLRGFYVGMPTCMTSNQAYDVVRQFLSGQGPVPPVRLLHSAADEHLKGGRGADSGGDELHPQGVDIDGAGDGDGEAGEWFTHKRGLLAPVGVGTVDQALMAALRTRHVFVRLAGLSGKVVVFDEVHGYDVQMSTLTDRLLWWLGSLRVPVVLLSATLPTHRERALVDSWRAGAAGRPLARRTDLSGSEPPGVSYPRVTWADTHCVGAETVHVDASTLNSERTVKLERVPFKEHASWAVRQARLGHCVAVVHNVVQYAADAYDEISRQIAALPPEERFEVHLIHGKLTNAERAQKEALLTEQFGRPGTGVRPERAVVVGTMLLEQGLDLDFDVMVSALAPVDSLIQRMGRIQRHAREGDRPPLTMALTGVEERPEKIVFPRYTTNVYAEAVLLRTWALLREREQLRCPDDVQGLIDAVYGPDGALHCPEDWERQWTKAADQMDRNLARRGEAARLVRLPQPRDDVQLWELTAQATSARRTREESYRRDDA